MSDDKIECLECADLEFARNLARQMKEGYGRHNSNRSFRHNHEEYGETEQVRVIGRFQDRPIRAKMEDCQIGDVTPVLDTDPKSPFFEFIKPRRNIFDGIRSCAPLHAMEKWIFERVITRLTSDNGQIWQDEEFWKRIE